MRKRIFNFEHHLFQPYFELQNGKFQLDSPRKSLQFIYERKFSCNGNKIKLLRMSKNVGRKNTPEIEATNYASLETDPSSAALDYFTPKF